MRPKSLIVAALCVLLPALSLRAQENILPLPLENLTLKQALEKSARDHRVLIVVREWKRPPEGRRPWWANDSVRAWITWHALMIKLAGDDPELDLYRKGVRADEFWGFDVYIDGRRCQPHGAGAIVENARDENDWGTTDWPAPTATMWLFQMQFKLDCHLERLPIWRMGHEQDCPEPRRPGRMYYSTKTADTLPAVDDLREPRKGDRFIDVAARLSEADRLAASGAARDAFAMLTWLWERGPEVDPAFGPVRVGLVLPRMVALAEKDELLAKRMGQIADAELALYPWYDDCDELGYLALRRAAPGGRGQIIKRAIVENIDLDEETMGALINARLGEFKARVTECAGDLTTPEAWKEMVRVSGLELPSYADQQDKKRWERQRVEVLTAGAVRTYAAMLATGRPDDQARADQIAADLLKRSAKATPAVRAAALRGLVFAAASVGRAGRTHAQWLAEATSLDPPTDTRLVDPLMGTIGRGTP